MAWMWGYELMRTGRLTARRYDPFTPTQADLQRALAERDEYEGDRCPHGVPAEDDCAECVYESNGRHSLARGNRRPRP